MFSPSVICRSVFQTSGSFLEVLGNVLVLVAIVYAIVQIGLRYGDFQIFPQWTEVQETRFQHVSRSIALHDRMIRTGLQGVMVLRKSNPKLEYVRARLAVIDSCYNVG